jgi:hypothetical protein
MTINQPSQVQHIVSESRAARIALLIRQLGLTHPRVFAVCRFFFTLQGEKEPAET